MLPRWNGTAFVSGSATIREEFERLVGLYGAIGGGSPAAGQADPALRAAGRHPGPAARRGSPDLGAFEAGASGAGDRPDVRACDAGGDRRRDHGRRIPGGALRRHRRRGGDRGLGLGRVVS